jgi:hypothetical protein
MTISTTNASQAFAGNSIATSFPCDFQITLTSDINVSYINPTTGAITPLVLNTDYTVTGAGGPLGFTLTTTIPVPTGTNLLVQRALPYTQPTDFTNQGAFFPTMHQAMADRLCMEIQQIAGKNALNLSMPAGLLPEPSTDLPIPLALAPLVWSADGLSLENGNFAAGDMLLRPDLAGTGAGQGGALVGFLQSGTGAVPRTQLSKSRDVVNVLDFGAKGDGVTDDGPAFQNAINALGASGGKIIVPQRNYACATKFVANAGVLLQGDTLNDNSASTNGSANALPRIFWSGPVDAGAMFTIKPATVGNVIYGGGSRNISWSGQSNASYAVRFDNTKNSVFAGRIDQVTHAGIDVCSDSGSVSNFSEHFCLERLDFVYGATAACYSAAGLLLRGNGSTIPGTQHQIGPCTGLVYNGFLVQIQECDNCQFEFIAGTRDTGGSGGSLKALNVGAQPASNNVFKYVGGYTTFDNGLIGNHILHFAAEGGSINQLAGSSSWQGSLIDYTIGKKFDSHSYQLRKKISIPAGAFVLDAQATQLLLAGQWDGVSLPDAVTSSISATLAPDYDIDAGKITAIELRVSSNGTSGGNLSLQVLLSSAADGSIGSVVTPEVSQTFTPSAAAQYVLTALALTFTTPLSVAAGDNLLLRIIRNGSTDTNTDACIVLSARLLFEGAGPNTGGSGPWYIPQW